MKFDYTYRQDRNIDTWTTLQNSDPAKKWTFAYDPSDRLTGAVREDVATQTILEEYGYGYDKAGNQTLRTDGSTTTHYPANTLNQTTAEQGFGPTRFSGTLDEPATVTVNGQSAQVVSDNGNAPYTFEALVDLAEGSNTVTIEAADGNSNVATQSYSVTVGGVQKTLEYDLNGNLRYEKDSSGAALREFQWDAKNRLVKIIDGTRETEFVYDGMDRRVRIIERENGVEQSNHVYIWDGSQIAQRRAANGATVERNYFDTGFTEGASSYFYTKDHLGSIREVVASDGTTVEASYDYSPWGEVTKIAGTGVESDFLYTGHFYHAESNLHLAIYRAYDPALGMWISRDPIAEEGGMNLYAYVENRPIQAVDPLGLMLYLPHASTTFPTHSGGECVGTFHMRPIDNPTSFEFLQPVTNTVSRGFAGYADHSFLVLSDGSRLSFGGGSSPREGDITVPLNIPSSIDPNLFQQRLKENWPYSGYNPFTNNCRQGMNDAVEKTVDELSPPAPKKKRPWWIPQPFIL